MSISFLQQSAVGSYDVDSPPFSVEEVRYRELRNLQVFRGALVPFQGFRPLEGMELPATALLPVGVQAVAQGTQQAYHLYVLSRSSTAQLFFWGMNIPEGGATTSADIEPEFVLVHDWEVPLAQGDVPALVSWPPYLFATATSCRLLAAQGRAMIEVDSAFVEGAGSITGRYMTVVARHLVVANIAQAGTTLPHRVQWSDLNDPFNWRIATDSDADFFDLPPGEQITGLTQRRDSMFIYTTNSIWRGTYVGLPEKFVFEQVVHGIGAATHNATITHKDRDYFLGTEDFYVFDGVTAHPTGATWINEMLRSGDGAGSVLGAGIAVDPQRDLFYVRATVGFTTILMLYNYRDNVWSRFIEQNVLSIQGVSLPASPRVAAVIDSFYTTVINTESLIDRWSAQSVTTGLPKTLFATSSPDNNFLWSSHLGKFLWRMNLSPLDLFNPEHNRLLLPIEATTFEMSFDPHRRVKELLSVDVQLVRTGGAVPTIRLVTRPHISKGRSAGLTVTAELGDETRVHLLDHASHRVFELRLTSALTESAWIDYLFGWLLELRTYGADK